MLSPVIEFGRDITGDFTAAESREWLCTNGIGGFASGTLAGSLARRYHGLLVAALAPPLGRTLLAAKLDEVVTYAGASWDLGVNRWQSGAAAPQGYRFVERFSIESGAAVWAYACADALIEKRVWMEQGANTTYVRYRLLRGFEPAALAITAPVSSGSWPRARAPSPPRSGTAATSSCASSSGAWTITTIISTRAPFTPRSRRAPRPPSCSPPSASPISTGRRHGGVRMSTPLRCLPAGRRPRPRPRERPRGCRSLCWR